MQRLFSQGTFREHLRNIQGTFRGHPPNPMGFKWTAMPSFWFGLSAHSASVALSFENAMEGMEQLEPFREHLDLFREHLEPFREHLELFMEHLEPFREHLEPFREQFK
jgi:hypothetical protein